MCGDEGGEDKQDVYDTEMQTWSRMMKSLRESFVSRFGEKDAERIVAAARKHREKFPSPTPIGDDEFRWAFLIAVGFECVSKYRDDHGIEASEKNLREWANENVEAFKAHVGDVDFLAVVAGAYNKYFPGMEQDDDKTE